VNEVNKEHEWLPHPAPPRRHSRATCEGYSRKRISMALIALPYSRTTNPVMAENARHVIPEVLADG